MNEPKFPLRLLVHFSQTRVPLVQVTDGKRNADGGVVGAGTRAIDLSDAQRVFTLPGGEQITAARVLDVLSALSKGG